MTDRLRTDYRTAGFAARLGFGQRPALLVVDPVRAYLEPDSPLYAGVEAEAEAMGRVLTAARDTAHPVWFTRVSLANDTDGGVFRRKVPALETMAAGSPLGEIIEPLAPRPDETVLAKTQASAFFGTPLASQLLAAGIDTVVIVGLTTSGCVRATAVDACQHGLVPVVVREAVGDRAREPHEASLFDLDAKYADVCGEPEVLEQLGRSA